MAGSIIGVFGKQRSGKTLFSYILVKEIIKQCKKDNYDIRVYSNIFTTDYEFKFINSASEIPLDLDPKIVFIDEIYNGCDAQDYKKLKDISIFVNTLGKQNCMFIFTSIEPAMVYNRIRNQMDICVLVKSNINNIYYRICNLDSNNTCDYIVKKDKELFRNIHYDTNFIPLEFDWNMKAWNEKLKKYYKDNYYI